MTRAAVDLDWSADARALKIIVVAGTEPATQDPRIRHVDAAKQAIAAGIPAADLPEELRTMTPAERRGHLDRLRRQRSRLQEQIRKPAQEQRRFIDAERARQGDTTGAGLDTALVAALTEQAAAKGFTFDRPEPAAAR